MKEPSAVLEAPHPHPRWTNNPHKHPQWNLWSNFRPHRRAKRLSSRKWTSGKYLGENRKIYERKKPKSTLLTNFPFYGHIDGYDQSTSCYAIKLNHLNPSSTITQFKSRVSTEKVIQAAFASFPLFKMDNTKSLIPTICLKKNQKAHLSWRRTWGVPVCCDKDHWCQDRIWRGSRQRPGWGGRGVKRRKLRWRTLA